MKTRLSILLIITFLTSCLMAQESKEQNSYITLGSKRIVKQTIAFDHAKNFVSLDDIGLFKRGSESTSLYFMGKTCEDGKEIFPLVSMSSQKSMEYNSSFGELIIDGLASGDILLYFEEEICSVTFKVENSNAQISFKVDSRNIATAEKSQKPRLECLYEAIIMRDQSASVSDEERHEVESTMTRWLESMKEEQGVELTLQNADFSEKSKLIDKRVRVYGESAMTYQSSPSEGLTSWSAALKLSQNQSQGNKILILLSDSPPNTLREEKTAQIELISSLVSAKKKLDEQGVAVLMAGFDNLKGENMRFWSSVLGLDNPQEFENMEISSLSPSDCSGSGAIEVFPNPASDQITITRQKSEKAVLDIINSEGRVVFSTELADKQSRLNLSQLSSGIYYISLDGKKQSQAFTIIK